MSRVKELKLKLKEVALPERVKPDNDEIFSLLISPKILTGFTALFCGVVMIAMIFK